MRKKITVVLENDIDKELRLIRAQKMRIRQDTVSFSTTINEVLHGQLD